MKILIAFQLILIASLVFLACSSPEAKKAGTSQSTENEIRLITKPTYLVAGFKEMDSLSVLYYNDPFEGDPERYTRFYKALNTTSRDLIDKLLANLSQPFKEDTLRNCRSEGKMYCFRQGKPVQTVYFTTQNERCRHLYFIHEGRYYYLLPDSTFFKALYAARSAAR